MALPTQVRILLPPLLAAGPRDTIRPTGIPWRTFEDIERRLIELERRVGHVSFSASFGASNVDVRRLSPRCAFAISDARARARRIPARRVRSRTRALRPG